MLENAKDTFNFLAFGAEDPPLKRSEIAKLPYASMTAKIGRGAKILLVLAYAERDDRHWFAGGGEALITRHGRLVKTVGLPENFRQTLNRESDPLAGPTHDVKDGTHFVRDVDFDGEDRFILPIESTFERVGPQLINILDVELETVLVRERNVAQTMNWSFENLYWVDAFDGYVWKSSQHVSRNFPPIEIEILKPPG
ncbi:MAG: YjbF family lipoprotein [Minwuiales bacterium]|nr:YjbF family lipoprotein [Minwuiales bacterium]